MLGVFLFGVLIFFGVFWLFGLVWFLEVFFVWFWLLFRFFYLGFCFGLVFFERDSLKYMLITLKMLSKLELNRKTGKILVSLQVGKSTVICFFPLTGRSHFLFVWEFWQQAILITIHIDFSTSFFGN